LRIAFTSDLHVEYHLEVVGHVARRVSELAPDVLVLAGDVCPDLSLLERSLRILKRSLRGPLLYVPGNHELWCGGSQGAGPHSRERYEVVLPTLARRAGALPLGAGPVRVGDVTFVGVTGWYDYSLRDPELEARSGPLDYESKRFGDQGCVDGLQVFWPGDDGAPLSDPALSDLMVQRLGAQLRQAPRAPVVVVTHMLARRDLLAADPARAQGDDGPRARDPARRFQDAFMGSAALGREIERHPAVRLVISGHHHVPASRDGGAANATLRYLSSPIGYPREIRETLEMHVSKRVSVEKI
jgi:hypothetical protein